MWVDQVPSCAPTVHPHTMQEVVRVESAGNPLSVHVNTLPASRQPRPTTTADAIANAKHWIALGYRVDLGLTQITDRNLPTLHLTIEAVLGTDQAATCANLAGGAQILTADYTAAAARFGPGQIALQAALSAYNTGTFDRGFLNGYVGRYVLVPDVTTVHQPRIITVATRHHTSDTEVWE